MESTKPHVALLTVEGFELSDGRFYPHPIPLEEDELPTIAKFQEYYDRWFNLLMNNDDGKTANYC